MQQEEFAPLHIIKKSLLDANRTAYRVYKNPQEFVTVEAATALEAFRESGIKQPFKIQRVTRFMEYLLDESSFSDVEDVVLPGTEGRAMPQAVQEPPPAEMAPADMTVEEERYVAEEAGQSVAEEDVQAVASTEAETEEESLSQDDIEALLGDSNAQQ